MQDKIAADLEAVKALLTFSVKSKGGIVADAPLTPQSSEIDSEDEKEAAASFQNNACNNDSNDGLASFAPMNLVKPKKETVSAPASPQSNRASVIMLAHGDGTYEPAALSAQPNNGIFGSAFTAGYGRPCSEPIKERPPPENRSSTKTSGTEMTSGHRDKNIPLKRGVVGICGDDYYNVRSHIATTNHAPMLNPNLNNTNRKYYF